jgi:hypothetical protein
LCNIHTFNKLEYSGVMDKKAKYNHCSLATVH